MSVVWQGFKNGIPWPAGGTADEGIAVSTVADRKKLLLTGSANGQIRWNNGDFLI